LETYLVVESVLIASALVILGLAAWVEASLGTVRELTIRELLSNRLSRAPDSDVDETTQLRSAMLLVQMLAAGVATALIAHLALDLEMPGSLGAGIVAGSLVHVLIARVVPTFIATTPENVTTSMTARTGRLLRLAFYPVIWPLERLQRYADQQHLRRDELNVEDGGHDAEGEAESDTNGQQPYRLDSDEHEMISGVLQLVNATADDIMVPRLDLVAVPRSATIAETVDVAIMAGHSRIPVYNENIDEIVGIVYAKDLLRYVTDGNVESTIEGEIRPAYFVPESKRADELLHELQTSKVHLAIVVDEYGGTAGVVTIEDILEEIVGEIEDEYDREHPRIEHVDETSIVVDGRLLVEDVLDELNLFWEERAHGTVAGLIQRELGRIPKPGDTVDVGDLRLTVETVERRRVRRVHCARLRPDELDVNGTGITVSTGNQHSS
jgi:CBS domain containing-hemolysin-like protein